MVVADLKTTTERLAQAIRGCSSEEDLRVNMELILREAVPDLPVPKYEQAVRTSTFFGRADAVHHGLILQILRHANVSTTMNIYVKTVSADAANAMKSLETMCATTVQPERLGSTRIM